MPHQAEFSDEKILQKKHFCQCERVTKNNRSIERHQKIHELKSTFRTSF